MWATVVARDGALSTANPFSAVQNGGSVFGLQFSNPVDPGVVYHGEVGQFGKPDPLVGQRIGGVNVFGGGVAIYDPPGQLLGASGLSTSPSRQ